jgi:hypothetical protein
MTTEKLRDHDGAGLRKQPETMPKGMRRIIQKLMGTPAQRRSLTPAEVKKIVEWNRDHPAQKRDSGPGSLSEVILEDLARYEQTEDGAHLMSALSLYFRFYAIRGNTDLVVEALREKFLRAWERWESGRMDPWDGASAPVRTLGQAFHVNDRDGKWKPRGGTALISPLTGRGKDRKRTSPGAKSRFIWTNPPPLKKRGRLTAEHIPVGVSVAYAATWTVEQLKQRGFVASKDAGDKRNVFVEAARLLSNQPDDALLWDGRSQRGRLGWVAVRNLYYANRPKSDSKSGK